MAKSSRRNRRIPVKEMRFNNDPMVRFYESTQEWLQERGRPVVLVVGIIVAAVLLYTAGYYFFEYRESKAQSAFAEAYEKYKAPVLGSVTTTMPTGKTYSDENTKWQETADAFERVANDYSGYYGSMARYYAGTAYLHLDRAKGMAMLEQVAGSNDQPSADLARFALAEAAMMNNEADKAISEYEKLLNSPHVPKQAVQFAAGRAYEKAGQTEKAVESYFEAAKVDRSSGVGADAEKRLSVLAPARVKELPAPSTVPLGLQ
ncbi:MAG TPA: hypothetical protein VJQ56_06710 [Blastocatellia bacterium]|nr:hypothetical protein [Blastocatellia bacterium]